MGKLLRIFLFNLTHNRFEEDGDILFYFCPSICLSVVKILVALFSATMHHSHFKLGMVLLLRVLHHLIHVCQLSTSCFTSLFSDITWSSANFSSHFVGVYLVSSYRFFVPTVLSWAFMSRFVKTLDCQELNHC